MNNEERIERACEVFRWWAEGREIEVFDSSEVWHKVGRYPAEYLIRDHPERYRLKPRKHVMHVYDYGKHGRSYYDNKKDDLAEHYVGIITYTDDQLEQP